MEEMSTLCITICRINKRNHRQHDRDHGKTQEYSREFFLVQTKHKGEEENEIPFKTI